MPNVEALPPEAVRDPKLKAAIADLERRQMPGSWFVRLLARTPEHGKALLEMLHVVNEGGRLPARLKSLVLFLLAKMAGDAYFGDGLRAHIARSYGISGSHLDSLVTDYDESSDLDERERLALRYAEQMFLDSKKIDDDFYGELKRVFSQPEIMELATIVGVNYAVYLLVSTLEATVADDQVGASARLGSRRKT